MNKIKENPKVQEYVEKLAKEVSQMLVNQFEKSKQADDATFNPDESMKAEMHKKGEELSSFVKSFLQEQQKDNQTVINKNNLMKVTIK